MLDHFGHVNFLEDQIIQITDNVGNGMARAEARNKCTFITWLLHGSSLFFSACYCWKADHNNATCSLGPFSWVSWHNFSCVASCSCLRFENSQIFDLNTVSLYCIIHFCVSFCVFVTFFFPPRFSTQRHFELFGVNFPGEVHAGLIGGALHGLGRGRIWPRKRTECDDCEEKKRRVKIHFVIKST